MEVAEILVSRERHVAKEKDEDCHTSEDLAMATQWRMDPLKFQVMVVFSQVKFKHVLTSFYII
jgi:hypothetical protein